MTRDELEKALSPAILETVLEWIAQNVGPLEIYEEENLLECLGETDSLTEWASLNNYVEDPKEWCSLNCHPGDVYDEAELERWANENGFVLVTGEE